MLPSHQQTWRFAHQATNANAGLCAIREQNQAAHLCASCCHSTQDAGGIIISPALVHSAAASRVLPLDALLIASLAFGYLYRCVSLDTPRINMLPTTSRPTRMRIARLLIVDSRHTLYSRGRVPLRRAVSAGISCGRLLNMHSTSFSTPRTHKLDILAPLRILLDIGVCGGCANRSFSGVCARK